MYSISLDEIAAISDNDAAELEMQEVDKELRSFVDEIRRARRTQ